MAGEVDAEALLRVVRDRDPAGTALDRIETAVLLGEDVVTAADDVVRRLVDDARRDGHSWTEIGRRLGVSKQAARKRFAEPAATSGAELELRPRLRSCLEAAGQEAARAGTTQVGSQYLLLGLFREGVAANVLDRLGLDLDTARAQVHQLFPVDPGEPAGGEPDECLRAATNLARERGCTQAGTEHLLFVLATDPGSRARRVLDHLGVSVAAIKKELACFLGSPPARRRWRRGRDESCRCSFCGQANRRMVNGPGIRICARCVQLCQEIIDQNQR